MRRYADELEMDDQSDFVFISESSSLSEDCMPGIMQRSNVTLADPTMRLREIKANRSEEIGNLIASVTVDFSLADFATQSLGS